MQTLYGGLCLITIAIVPIYSAQDAFDRRGETGSKDSNTNEKSSFDAEDQMQSLADVIGGVIAHRQKKSLKFHRPHFLGGDTQNKIDVTPHPLARESLQRDLNLQNAEILNSPREKAALNERIDADEKDAQGFNFPPKLFGKRSAQSRVQKSLDDILSSIQKREVKDLHMKNDDALNDEFEDNGNQGKSRVEPTLLGAKIKDLNSQAHALSDTKSKLLGDKSDLELLHDIIDKHAQKSGQNEGGDRKIKNSDTVRFYESSMDNEDAPSSHKADHKIKSGRKKESFHDTSREEVSGSLLDSDLERMIQEAAEKIGQWVNENFDTAKKMKKTQAVKKQHFPKHNSSFEDTGEDATSKTSGVDLDEDTKKYALKFLLHAANPEAKNEAENDELDDAPKKRKNKNSRLSVEVKKMKMSTLPPCFTSSTRHPECNKCLPTLSAKDLDPKLLEALCSKPTTKPPCTQTTRASSPSTSANATRKVHPPSTPRTGRPSTTEINAALSDKLFKKLTNVTFKDSLTDSLVGDRNSSHSKGNLSELADFLHMLVNAAESMSSNVTIKDSGFPCNKLNELFSSNSTKVSKSNLKTEHSPKSNNNKLLNHFVSLATVDSGAKKLHLTVAPDKLTEQTDSPLRALAGILDLMRRQSSETISSQKSLLEDRSVSEQLRIQPSGNQTVALNVFIKAAIIPDLKNSSLKHAAKAAVRTSAQPGRGETARPRTVDSTLVSPRSRFTDNTLNNLLRSIIVKARFERQVVPEKLRALVESSRQVEENN